MKEELVPRECIILAGGFGTRLRTEVSDRPKCLAEMDERGTPFLKILIDYLIRNGVTKLVLSLGFMHEMITEFIKDSDFPISIDFVIENEPLGTGGAIKKAVQKSLAENVLIVNADTYFDVDIDQLFVAHLEMHPLGTIALKFMEKFDRYGSVEINKEKFIVSFNEKIFTEKGLINGGVILLNKALFLAYNLPDKFSFETDFLPSRVSENLILGFESEGYFIDIGVPEDYKRSQKELSKFNTNDNFLA